MLKPDLLNKQPVRAYLALALQIFTAAALANGPERPDRNRWLSRYGGFSA